MNRTLQNIVYSPLWLLFHGLALLPFCALYLISDLLAFVARDVVRYRRRMVDLNLAASFPEMSEAERNKVARRFYRNFTDVFIETIKLLHVSDKAMKKRMVFEGKEVIDRHVAEGRSVGLYCSHFCNWEWITSVTQWTVSGPQVCYSQVYRPLRNRWFDEFYFGLRKRFGSESIPKNGVLRALLACRREGAVFVTGFISDQKPSHNDGHHHVPFLSQQTYFITGTETLLRKMHAAVVYTDIQRVGRGHYRARLIPVVDDAAACEQHEITDRYARLLEATIRRQPESWLWSHNRWRRPKNRQL